MIPVANDSLLVQLDPMKIQCSPEPPWIKRCTYGIKFTDDIQPVDVEFPDETVDDEKKKQESESSDQNEEPKESNVESQKKVTPKKSRPNSTGQIKVNTQL